jgi:hypothetical protein
MAEVGVVEALGSSLVVVLAALLGFATVYVLLALTDRNP